MANYTDLFIMITLIIIALALLQFLKNIFSRSTNKHPPGPIPFPLIGNLHLIGNKPHKSFANLSKTYGPIMSLKLGHVTTMVISSAELAREVLQKQDLAFSSRYIPNAIHALDHHKYSMAWIPVGPRWRILRKVVSSNLDSSKRFEATQCLRKAKVEELIAFCFMKSQADEVVDIGEAVFVTILNLISNSIFSKDLIDPFSDSGKGAEFKDLINKMFHEIGRSNVVDLFPFLEKIDPQGIRRRLTNYWGKMFQIVSELIDQRLEERKSQGTIHHDMLDVLLTISEENPEDFDRTHIEHLCLDLFEGTAGIPGAIEWAMAEIFNHAKIMSKIQEELSNVIGKGKLVEETYIAHLSYLNCVIKENYRLHPIVPFLIPRRVIQDVEVYGHMIPKNSRVLVNTWAIGRDPNVFENPLEFKPERFLNSEIDVRGLNYELLPFGGGRRICPGIPLVTKMVPVLLGSLLNSFNWKLESGVTIGELSMEEECGITLERATPLKAFPIPL